MMFLDRLAARRNQRLPQLLRPLQRAGFLQQPIKKINGTTAWINGRPLLNCVASNYLGLNQHPYVVKAASQAAQNWGISLSMPRLLATDKLTCRLETAVARLTGQEQALIQQAGMWHILQFNPRERPAGGVLRFILTAVHHQADVDRLTTVIHDALHDVADNSDDL